jgi:hypothetical protein
MKMRIAALPVRDGSLLFKDGTFLSGKGTPKLINPIAKCKTTAGDPKCLILKILPKPVDIKQKSFKIYSYK